MPYLNVRLATLPSSELAADVVRTLTDLTATLLQKRREVTAVNVQFCSLAEWGVAGGTLQDQGLSAFHVEISVTEGTNSASEKARFIAEVWRFFNARLTNLSPASYVVVREVPGESWGFQGRTQAHRLTLAQAA